MFGLRSFLPSFLCVFPEVRTNTQVSWFLVLLFFHSHLCDPVFSLFIFRFSLLFRFILSLLFASFRFLSCLMLFRRASWTVLDRRAAPLLPPFSSDWRHHASLDSIFSLFYSMVAPFSRFRGSAVLLHRSLSLWTSLSAGYGICHSLFPSGFIFLLSSRVRVDVCVFSSHSKTLSSLSLSQFRFSCLCFPFFLSEEGWLRKVWKKGTRCSVEARGKCALRLPRSSSGCCMNCTSDVPFFPLCFLLLCCFLSKPCAYFVLSLLIYLFFFFSIDCESYWSFSR